jgi:hypothetical protein
MNRVTLVTRARKRLCTVVPLAFLALTGCVHTSYLTRSCLTKEQYEQLKSQEPPRIKDKLTGKADEDTRPLAGSAIELRAWGHALLDTLRICTDPNK